VKPKDIAQLEDDILSEASPLAHNARSPLSPQKLAIESEIPAVSAVSRRDKGGLHFTSPVLTTTRAPKHASTRQQQPVPIPLATTRAPEHTRLPTPFTPPPANVLTTTRAPESETILQSNTESEHITQREASRHQDSSRDGVHSSDLSVVNGKLKDMEQQYTQLALELRQMREERKKEEERKRELEIATLKEKAAELDKVKEEAARLRQENQSNTLRSEFSDRLLFFGMGGGMGHRNYMALGSR